MLRIPPTKVATPEEPVVVKSVTIPTLFVYPAPFVSWLLLVAIAVLLKAFPPKVYV
jgi:hypothetical protein